MNNKSYDSQLQITLFKCLDKNIYTDAVCPISLEEFKEDDVVCITECNHVFLKINLDKWLEQNDNCPMCKAHVYKLDELGKINEMSELDKAKINEMMELYRSSDPINIFTNGVPNYNVLRVMFGMGSVRYSN